MPSSEFVRSAFAQESDETWLVLVTLDHDSLSEPIRVVNNKTDVISNGDTFLGAGFEVELPTDTEDGVPEARLRVDDITGEITAATRTVTSRMQVGFEIVSASNLDDVEFEFNDLVLESVDSKDFVVTGVLSLSDIAQEPFPAHSFIPAWFTGMF